MKVAKKIPTCNIGHNMLDRSKSSLHMRGVVHGKENSRYDLQSEKQASKRAEASVVV